MHWFISGFFCGVRVANILVFWVVFRGLLFVLLDHKFAWHFNMDDISFVQHLFQSIESDKSFTKILLPMLNFPTKLWLWFLTTGTAYPSGMHWFISGFFCGVRVANILVFWVVFRGLLFVLLSITHVKFSNKVMTIMIYFLNNKILCTSILLLCYCF
jgi:hypothetical protein